MNIEDRKMKDDSIKELQKKDIEAVSGGNSLIILPGYPRYPGFPGLPGLPPSVIDILRERFKS